MIKMKWFLILGISTLMLTACGGKQTSEHPKHEEGHQEHLPNGDIQEQTASADVLPKFLDNQSEDMRLIYQAAGKAAGILEWMPCYCGCGESAGHKSNLNCFISEVKKDGAIVWDDHGTRCLVCLEIAVKSIKMSQEGKSLKEIRQMIDEQYKEGYSAPTNTPMPS